VENVLLTHPAVAEARVFAVPDEEYGELPIAHVVRRNVVQAEELIAYARQRLVPAKVPRSIGFVDELPLTSTGKPRVT
jgi:acyl-CoA synthetase (AMP-forming)/AMP-acid ligase II